MYFRNNELGNVLPPDMKPTPLPRNTASANRYEKSPTAPLVKTLNENCHEIINTGGCYQPGTSLDFKEARNYSDDETAEIEDVDYSNDPHQRLIM